jgi:hypothetical protein
MSGCFIDTTRTGDAHLTVIECRHMSEAERPFTWLHRVRLADGTECSVIVEHYRPSSGLPDTQKARDQWYRYMTVMAGMAEPEPGEAEAYQPKEAV